MRTEKKGKGKAVTEKKEREGVKNRVVRMHLWTCMISCLKLGGVVVHAYFNSV